LKPMQELVKNLPRFGILSGINKSYEAAKIRGAGTRLLSVWW